MTTNLSPRMRRKVDRALSGSSSRDPSSIQITDSEVTLEANRTGELSQIVDIRVPSGYIYAFPGDRPIQMFMMVHEQETTDGTAGTDETFSLDHNLVNSPSVRDADTSQTSDGAEVDSNGHQDLVVYDSGTQKAVVSVDYSADQFTYADAETASTLDVYYLWGEPSEVAARSYTADFEEYKQVLGTSANELHRSSVYSEQEMVTWTNNFALNAKERLRFYINTSVDLTNWDATGGGGPNSTTSYSYFQLPVYKIKK